MSKELKALNHLRDRCCDYLSLSCNNRVCSDFKIIETALKALEIIKEKPWLVNEIVGIKGNYDVYKSWCKIFRADMKYMATQEEHDLLKEVLCSEN